MRKRRYTPTKAIVGISILAGGLVLLLVFSINFGPVTVTPQRVIMTILGQGTPRENLIVFTYRLPRLLLGVLVGVGMAVAGTVMQSLLRNNLASPGTLGISSGAGLFMIIYVSLFFGDNWDMLTLPLLAFAGGVTAAGIIFILSKKKGKPISPLTLILTGVAVSGGYSAVHIFFMLLLDRHKYDFVIRWQAGDLWGTQWPFVMILTLWLCVFISYIYFKSRVLNAINLGNDTATGLGVAVGKEFVLLMLSAVAISSAAVAFGGNFFFVGLISPHIAKRLFGSNHKFLLPAAALIGAVVVVFGDVLARNIGFLQGVPTGIVITVISTPYFLYLLSKA